jgi:hypothetical protein
MDDKYMLATRSNMGEKLKLTIELVPKTSWYDNMRKVLPKSEWDKLRRKTYAEHGYRCGICEAEGRLNCHEIWEYDDNNHKQTLLGFIALCDLCHHVKHIGLAGILASKGQLDIERVVEHFMKVNRCERSAFEEHKKKACAQWAERSKHNWNVDLGKYERLVKKRHNTL